MSKQFSLPSSLPPSPFELTQAQIADLKEKLVSIKRHGIVPAQQVPSLISHPIPSSELKLAPEVCANVVDLKVGDPKKLLPLLVSHASHGLINMAIERHHIVELKDMTSLGNTVRERALASLVFVLKPPQQQKGDTVMIAPFAEHAQCSMPHDKCCATAPKGIHEIKAQQVLKPETIMAILAPTPLLTHAKDIFPNVPIFDAPFRQGDLCLSAFTLSTTVNALFCTPKDWLVDIILPDYLLALQQCIETLKITTFATHITRVVTPYCLQHPFVANKRGAKAREPAGKGPSAWAKAKMHMYSEKVKAGKDLDIGCEFKISPFHCYALPKEKLDALETLRSFGIPLHVEVDKKHVEGPYRLVRMQSSWLKSQKNSVGGLREQLDVSRIGCQNLSADQLKYLREHPYITLESSQNAEGKPIHLLTFPTALQVQVTEICGNGPAFRRKTEQNVLVIQSFLRRRMAIDKVKVLQCERLEQQIKQVQAKIHQHTDASEFDQVIPLAEQAMQLQKQLKELQTREHQVVSSNGQGLS